MADKGEKTVKYWLTKIEKAKNALKDFTKEAQKAADAARNSGDRPHEFNIMWANRNVLESSIYGNFPKPDVRKRHRVQGEPNPDDKLIAQMVERAIEYAVDTTDFGPESQRVVGNYIDVGLGVPRVIYDVSTDGEDDDERITSQSVSIEYVPWNHFLWEPGKTWKHVDWIAYKSFHAPSDVEDEYGIVIKGGGDEGEKKRKSEEYAEQLLIWEIYYKPTRTIYVITPSHPKPLEVRKDALKLQGFFPSPQPLFANLKHDELIPRPDYMLIEKQVIELNKVTGRILSLTSQIKDISFYDQALGEQLKTAMDMKDGAIVAVNSLGATGFANLQATITHLPMREKIEVVQALMQQRDLIIKQIYDVTGISDIARGSTEKQETATAQQIKSQYGNVRLSEKIGKVARIWRDVFRMWAEIYCEHFDPQQLYLMTGIQVTPGMMEIMHSDVLRSFSIDIETDSTIQRDDYENRQQTMDLVQMLVDKLGQLVPGVQSGLLPVNLVQEILIFAISAHKHGKQLEDAVMELGPHLQGLLQFQQQMQQLQQQMMQQQQQLEQAGQQGQALQQQNQQLQQEIGKFNERKEMREDAATKSKLAREAVDIEAQRIENALVARDLQVPQPVADYQKTVAETDKIRSEIQPSFIGVING